MLRCSLLFIAAMLVPCAGTSAQMRTTLSAPFDLAIGGTGGQYTVDAMINGHGPYKLILDTGTSAIALDLGLVKELGLEKTGDRTENMPFNTKMQITVYGADSLRVGNLLLNDVHVDGIRFPAAGGVRGIIGLPAFHDVLLTIDIAHNHASVGSGRLNAKDRDVMPFEWNEDIIGLRGTVAGKPMLFHLDSGSPGYVTIPKSVADSVPFLAPLVQTGGAQTLAGGMKMYGMQLKGALKIGKLRFDDPKIQAFDPSPYPAGNIGTGFVRNYVLTIDQRNKLVRFSPVAAVAPVAH